MNSSTIVRDNAEDKFPPSLRQVVLYFLRLGSLGFGGPVALANHIRRDLVETRNWLSEQEYNEGLAIATACPGPLAYQLAIYCGYIRFGMLGGLAVAVSFALTPFVLVVLAANFYVRFSANWQLRALFYGIGPVVIALILKACWNLGKRTLRKEVLAWVFFSIACAITIVVEKELAVLFLVAGAIGIFVFAKNTEKKSSTDTPAPHPAPNKLAGIMPAATALAAGSLPMKIFLFFFKTGLLVFGSGLVIVPFLKTYVVDQYHWLNNRQFLDSVAIGMISPGPVVITATFVGFLLSGFWGALAATVGIFSPSVLFTVFATPLLRRYRNNARLQGFIRGVTVTVVGVLVGTAYLVGKTAIGDWVTLAIACLSLALVFVWKKLPEPLLVLVGALIGLFCYRFFEPQWLLK